MTISKVTTERLKQIASGNAFTCTQGDESAAMAAELLAVREAQSVPIGCIKTICGNKTLKWWRDAPEGAEVFTAPPAPAVHAGFKLVPVELLSTASMLIDLCRTHTTLNGGGTYNQRVLSDCETTMNAIASLLAAAPTPTK